MVQFMIEAFNPFKAPVRTRRAILIIAAARAIIAEAGPEAVTRRRIAELTGLRPVEVSRVFHDRAALMNAAASFDGSDA